MGGRSPRRLRRLPPQLVDVSFFKGKEPKPAEKKNGGETPPPPTAAPPPRITDNQITILIGKKS